MVVNHVPRWVLAHLQGGAWTAPLPNVNEQEIAAKLKQLDQNQQDQQLEQKAKRRAGDSEGNAAAGVKKKQAAGAGGRGVPAKKLKEKGREVV